MAFIDLGTHSQAPTNFLGVEIQLRDWNLKKVTFRVPFHSCNTDHATLLCNIVRWRGSRDSPTLAG